MIYDEIHDRDDRPVRQGEVRHEAAAVTDAERVSPEAACNTETDTGRMMEKLPRETGDQLDSADQEKIPRETVDQLDSANQEKIPRETGDQLDSADQEKLPRETGDQLDSADQEKLPRETGDQLDSTNEYHPQSESAYHQQNLVNVTQWEVHQT